MVPGVVDVDFDLDALLPGHLAARLVGVTPQLLQWWRQRRRHPLVAADHDAEGRPLFRVRDVFDAERSTRRSSKSSRQIRSGPARGDPAPAGAGKTT